MHVLRIKLNSWSQLTLFKFLSSLQCFDQSLSALDYRSTGLSGAVGYVEGQSAEQIMKEDEQFPLLFEGSSFYHTSPIVHDITGDGIADAILGDYDGTLHFIVLDFEPSSDTSHQLIINNDNDDGKGHTNV